MSDGAVGCIVGAVVRLHSKARVAACCQLEGYTGVEIHAEDEQGRLVITLETSSSREMATLTEQIQNLSGVLQVTPVYQYCEEYSDEKQQGGWTWR